jgi:hypothetical protein
MRKRKVINLKYSDNLLQDYKKLSTGRKLYIEKRAAKKSISLEKYLEEKYNV